MFGTMFCQYETPCGWCAKFDKPCTEKMSKPKKSGQIIKKNYKRKTQKY